VFWIGEFLGIEKSVAVTDGSQMQRGTDGDGNHVWWGRIQLLQ